MQTVLVVEDDPSVRDLLQVILNMEGFTVLVAESADEALRIAHETQVDLVTIDLSLQGMPAAEFSARLRADPASARTLQMIVSGSTRVRGIAADLHADAVLPKPFDFSTFTSVLHDLIDRDEQANQGMPIAALIDGILRDRLIRPAYQPIVDLATREVVGVESLARAPEAGEYGSPGPLFDAAHRAGRLFELDALCRYAAIVGAADAVPATPKLVFVNVEPSSVELPMSRELRARMETGLPFRTVVEFTERALTKRLPALMRHAEELRSHGHLIALDDLGVDPQAVALLPLLEPEVVKLDMSLLAGPLSRTGANTAVAVAAYAERTGAKVVAEGIETEEQLTTALALGAHWGQGYLFAQPGPMNALATMAVDRSSQRLPQRSGPADLSSRRTPFTLAADGRQPRRATVGLINGISHDLEQHARMFGDLGVLLIALQDHRNVPTLLDRGYRTLAENVAFLGILGRGVANEPIPGAYGVGLDSRDPLAKEWTMVVLGPHTATTLAARDIGDRGPLERRRVDFVLSHDRQLAEEVARLLVRRFRPRRGSARMTAIPRQSGG